MRTEQNTRRPRDPGRDHLIDVTTISQYIYRGKIEGKRDEKSDRILPTNDND